MSGYFDDPAKLLDALEEASKYDYEGGVYWCLNPVKPDLLARAANRLKPYSKLTTADGDIVRREIFVIDFDPFRATGISASAEEKAAAKEACRRCMAWLREQGWPLPLRADSGNGYHLLFYVGLPNDAASRDLLSRCLQALAAKFDVEGVVGVDVKMFNASRICKAYGTSARKGDHTEGRPHRVAQMLPPKEGCEPTEVPRELLEALAALAPKAEPRKAKGNAKEGSGPWTRADVERLLEFGGAGRTGRRWTRGRRARAQAVPEVADGVPQGRGPQGARLLRHAGRGGRLAELEVLAQLLRRRHERRRAGGGDGGAGGRGVPRQPGEAAGRRQGIQRRRRAGHGRGGRGRGPSGGGDGGGDGRGGAGWKAACKALAMKITDIERLPERPRKDDPWMQRREKNAAVCRLVHRHLLGFGRFFNCGHVATYVPDGSREIVEIVKEGEKFQPLLNQLGILPSDQLAQACGKYLGSLAPTFPKATVWMGSFYDRDRHMLYVNEWGGSFLRIDGAGNVDRLRNGDDGMLFGDGRGIGAARLTADLAALPEKGLFPDEGSLLVGEILDTIKYDGEQGLSRDDAHVLLSLAIVELFLLERCPSYPLVEFEGSGGTMKTSLAIRLGKLLVGPKFMPTLATADPAELKIMAMTQGYLVLDEANDQRKLADALKAIATGAQDVRRELYTTAGSRTTPFQARVWLTVNQPTAAGETVAARKLMIKAGGRTEKEPYRSEHYLWRALAAKRDALWTELVGRLRGVMRSLAAADAGGEGDLPVPHRMSSFLVLGLSIARQEGWEQQFRGAMEAMARTQQESVAEHSKIVPLILGLPASYNGTARTANEWAGILAAQVPTANVELARQVANPSWLAWHITSQQLMLAKVCGMEVGERYGSEPEQGEDVLVRPVRHRGAHAGGVQRGGHGRPGRGLGFRPCLLVYTQRSSFCGKEGKSETLTSSSCGGLLSLTRTRAGAGERIIARPPTRRRRSGPEEHSMVVATGPVP